ncbi:MAG: hypothetical protein R8M14_00285 [Ghiorsea sp.]
MQHLFKTVSFAFIANTLIFITSADAKSGFLTLQPTAYNGAIGCTTCHSNANGNENNVTQPYGILFKSKVGYNNASSAGYIQLEGDDVDSDGFTNGQEIYGFSDVNSSLSKPVLFGTGVKTSGSISVNAAVNESVDNVTQVLTTPTNVTTLTPTGHRNIGGTVDLTLSSLTSGQASPTLLYKTGGITKGATAYFVDANGTASAISTATVNNNGSITLQLTDEGPYDLYTNASYIASAKNRTLSVDPTATISPYATVAITAVISPYATINDYATVGAYAVIGNSAIVDTYAVVDDYAVVADSSTVAANSVHAAPTNYLGVIQTKVAVVTGSPLGKTITDGGAASGGANAATTGQLHCMTSGLGIQGLMFLGLFAVGFIIRRKRS